VTDATQDLRISQQFGRYLFDSTLDGVTLADESGRIIAANPAACEMFGRREDQLSKMAVTDLAEPSDERFASLLKERKERGWAQGEATFVRADATRFIALVTSTLFQDADGIVKTVTAIRDVTAFKRLQGAFHGTVEAISKLVEARDPYTAGHQRRVAELAEKIGEELDLPPEQLKGLRVTGFIHDVGKIGVPAEILTKPTRLDETEFALVKRHSQIGYEVLKTVDFHWPVAQTVLQHHERIDGSGYPQGLKGDSILLDARIVAVADVVESMASHRPYRPSLGIDAALAEIERGRKTLYDAGVADACIKLFRMKRYQLPT